MTTIDDAKHIKAALERAKRFLMESRDPDGLWSVPREEYRLPAQYQLRMVKSAHACSALISAIDLLSERERAAMEESLFTVLTMGLEEDAPVDYHALRLLLCAHSNTALAARIRESEMKHLFDAQHDGFWQSYSNTYHFTNLYILTAFQQNGIPAPASFANWALQHRSKRGAGWGFSPDDRPQPSTTATILLACLLSGVSTNNQKIIDAALWLESAQNPDGGWHASTLTEAKKSTYHSTANAIFCIILTTGDLGRKSVKEGVQFLLRGQKKDGSWPHTTDDPTTHLFTVNYAVALLAFVRFLLEADSPQHLFVKNCLTPAEYARYMYAVFTQQTRDAMRRKSAEELLFTRALGTTKEAQERRRDIMAILSAHSPLDDAEIIEHLQRHDARKYGHMRKKNHLTVIKNDVQYLASLHLVRKLRRKHYLITMPIPADG